MDFGLQEDHIPSNYTIALGTPQVLPVQMATGYATFANGGYRIQPHFINRIEDAYGKVIYQANPEYACIPCINEDETQVQDSADAVTPDDEIIADIKNSPTKVEKKSTDQYRQAQRILKSSSAYDMANILQDVIVHGTGRAALSIGRNDLGGKTGTTNDAKDAWFAGFNGKLVTITWVGFDQPTTLGRREYGGVAALPIWTNFMAKALEGTPESWVRLDNKNASTVHEKLDKPTKPIDRSTPPLAQSVQRPMPATAPSTTDSDFSDLPDKVLTPVQKAPPPMQNKSEAKPSNQKKDALEDLIDQVQ